MGDSVLMWNWVYDNIINKPYFVLGILGLYAVGAIPILYLVFVKQRKL